MSVNEIKTALKQIKKLSPAERTKVSTCVVKELTPYTLEAKVQAAVESGEFNGLFAKAMLDYSQGKALDRIY